MERGDAFVLDDEAGVVIGRTGHGEGEEWWWRCFFVVSFKELFGEFVDFLGVAADVVAPVLVVLVFV